MTPEEILPFLDQIKAEALQEAKIELVSELLKRGFSPQSVSSLTSTPVTQVTQILNVNLGGRIRTPEDEELAIAARKLALRAISEANLLLDIGPMPAKLAMIRAVLPAAARLVGNSQEGDSHEEAFAAHRRLMESMKELPNAPSTKTITVGTNSTR